MNIVQSYRLYDKLALAGIPSSVLWDEVVVVPAFELVPIGRPPLDSANAPARSNHEHHVPSGTSSYRIPLALSELLPKASGRITFSAAAQAEYIATVRMAPFAGIP
jgi:hypothetical protein